MPPPARGTIQWHGTGTPDAPQPGDHWDARLRLGDGSRPWKHLQPGLTEAQARARAAVLTSKARAAGATMKRKDRAPVGEFARAWLDRWLDAREAKGVIRVRTDRQRVRDYVAPVLGDRPMAAVTKADLEAVVRALDALVVKQALGWKSALNTWGLVSRACRDAATSKDPALRCREDNPAAGVAPPDRGIRKAKQFLWPSEFATLVACAAVPVRWRRAIAAAVYLYCRAAELEALERDDFDPAHGTLHVHRSIDRDRDGARKSTKNGEPRRFAVEPEALPLLRALHAAAPTGSSPLVDVPNASALAGQLRAYLKLAGVTRADLHTRDATRLPITWHDLRATGITWMAVRGDAALRIKHRAGHKTLATTEHYIRQAEALRDGFGTPFPALPPELAAGVVRSGIGPDGGGGAPNPAESQAESGVPGAGLEPAERGTWRFRASAKPRKNVGIVPPPPAPATPRDAPPDPKTERQTERPAAPADPRTALVTALRASAAAAMLAGDLDGARATLDALARLEAPTPTAGVAPVLDLATRRR